FLRLRVSHFVPTARGAARAIGGRDALLALCGCPRGFSAALCALCGCLRRFPAALRCRRLAGSCGTLAAGLGRIRRRRDQHASEYDCARSTEANAKHCVLLPCDLQESPLSTMAAN